jgi:phosphatidylglycerol:prolipoprotein diacylglycerol transferase
MLQIIFRLHLFGHEIPIYGYGLMLVVAFIACILTSQWLGRCSGIDPELFSNAVLIGLISGVIGARLCHILENFGAYTRSDFSVLQNLRHMIDIREGGLTYYGGFLFATPCCILYAIKNKVPILLGMDIVAPVLMIGLGIGRIGCFLNGCCYGVQSDLPWAVSFPYYSEPYFDQFEHGQIMPPQELLTLSTDRRLILLPKNSLQMQRSPALQALANQTCALPVQPTQLYSTFTALLLAGLLIAYFTLPHIDGRVFALMLILEGFSRYVLEILRVEPSVWTIQLGGGRYGLSISMILGIISVVAGIAMWTFIRSFGNNIERGAV